MWSRFTNKNGIDDTYMPIRPLYLTKNGASSHDDHTSSKNNRYKTFKYKKKHT